MKQGIIAGAGKWLTPSSGSDVETDIRKFMHGSADSEQRIAPADVRRWKSGCPELRHRAVLPITSVQWKIKVPQLQAARTKKPGHRARRTASVTESEQYEASVGMRT
ncbi:hypothetical protein HRR83_002356 [Exophiala dermatitidis]|uniref:Uncharacterized protein n=1 Tax=Exophiala dermatitidis TaxID=5970 RepID=A0AAN6EVW8_EXODE|nr:hypothetical protein HRR74_002433 [Exophiala dermatitidis]KAJ4536808.1 hypothetical protein HRR76_004834 [Exophiala dermatitidis]KAJ4555590.1 hypothetical protein HRR77_001520 [Exophiala dermatitidis]KAJ4568894.1 hypothetical protein HRR81_006551 [Exophiala dermatitidis]KAJ4572093.1 hypothetical protein HRR79_003299 [Exophiala dermatitidis]